MVKAAAPKHQTPKLTGEFDTSGPFDPEKQYHVKLKKPAMLGSTYMRPNDRHIVRGDAITSIDPQSSVEHVEPV